MQGAIKGWTVKRIILSLLSVVMGLIVFAALLQSWNEPQVQGKLELYQTNILLQAASLDDRELQTAQIPSGVYQSLVGKEALAMAKIQYESARTDHQQSTAKIQQRLKQAELNPETKNQQTTITELSKSLKAGQRNCQKIELELGLIQAVQQQPTAAQQTWQELKRELPASPLVNTADVLTTLWTPEKSVPAQASQLIDRDLQGWFRYQALRQLYQKQGATTELAQLQTNQITAATAAIYKLASLTLLRGGGLLGGVIWGLWLLAGQLLKMRKSPPPSYSGGLVVAAPKSTALTKIFFANEPKISIVPWDGEIIWQVVLGFLVVGQLLLPILLLLLRNGLQSTGFNLAEALLWQKAAFTFFSYLLLAVGVTSFLWYSIAPYRPLSADWFSFKGTKNWVIWGLGGYLVATPIVLLVSVVNDKIWQGKGGSNPILSIVLDNKDNWAFAFFVLTAAVAAPLFEEYLFRGFLMPSLMRYFYPWQAIALSGVIFAAAHLSLSELVPLTVLGMILGYIYYRTGNLLASMLLHSLWNGGSMLTLYLLAS
jgi:uncharacterized protein